MLKNFKTFILNEDKNATEEEYNKALEKNFSKKFVDEILSYDNHYKEQFGEPTIKTTGNLYVKYKELPDTILLFGLISNEGKMKKEDIKDMKKWLEKLEKKIKEGKTLYTSLNKYSKNFIEKMLKNNPSFKKTSINNIEYPEGKWETISITR